MAREVKEGQGASGELFVRRASGLTRTVSPWSALVYAFVCPTMTFAFLYYTQEQTLYLGAKGFWTSFTILLLFPIAAVYVFMSLSMPRSGGEYIYVSRTLNPLLGFIASWTLTIVGINWSGLLSQWTVNWGFGNTFLAEGLATGNKTLVHWGQVSQHNDPRQQMGDMAPCLRGPCLGVRRHGYGHQARDEGHVGRPCRPVGHVDLVHRHQSGCGR